MNYEIIKNMSQLLRFIAWLPKLEDGECYYVALFARKKYHSSAKNDKTQCKRFTATNKDWLLIKLIQLEIRRDMYTNKDGSPVHQDSLAVYISVNPRSFSAAQRLMIKKLADSLCNISQYQNPSSMALSCIQKAKSRTCYVDFDFDNVKYNDFDFTKILNEDAYEIIETRGGFHLLVKPQKVDKIYQNNWYKRLIAIDVIDASGDNLVPIPGCTQGGFTPIMIK